MKIKIYPRVKIQDYEIMESFVPDKITEKYLSAQNELFRKWKITTLKKEDYLKQYHQLEKKYRQEWDWNKYNSIKMESLIKYLKWWFSLPIPRASTAIKILEITSEYCLVKVNKWFINRFGSLFDYQYLWGDKWKNGRNFDPKYSKAKKKK